MKRRRASKLTSLQSIGRGDGFDADVRAPFSMLAVFDAWTRSLGPQLRKVTRALEWRNGRLVVEVSDPIWLRHLETMSDRILEEVNGALSDASVPESRRLRIDSVVLRPGTGGSPSRGPGGGPPR